MRVKIELEDGEYYEIHIYNENSKQLESISDLVTDYLSKLSIGYWTDSGC